MSYSKLVSDLTDLFKKEGTGSPTDMQDHADGFATAVDDYVKKLEDPGKRTPSGTTKILMIAPLIAIGAAPGTGDATTDATKSALQYATAVQLYALAISIDKSKPIQNIPGVPPSSSIISGVVATPTLLTSLQNDLKSIFTEETPEGVSIEILIPQKAKKFADAIQKAFTEGTLITISGLDSSPPPPPGPGPQSFTLTGPFKEP